MNILFPIETISRELDFRIALGVMLAAKDRKILIGHYDALHNAAAQLRGGIYLGKNIFYSSPPADLSVYKLLKQRNFKVIYLHEEGAIFQGSEEDWKRALDRQFDPRVFRRDDWICTWGEFQREYTESLAPWLQTHIRVTGHPRFDLYKRPFRSLYRKQSEALREKLGQFVLINTNFGIANHGKGLRHLFSLQNKSKEAAELLTGKWAHTTRILLHFTELIWRLSAEFPNIHIVIRPHPSEDLSTYEHIFAGVPNIQVIQEGPVGPWILACQALIHEGCTTAVEAYLADATVITFKPEDDPRYDLMLPNSLGRRCQTVEEVEVCLHDILATRDTQRKSQTQQSPPTFAKKLLYNLEHSSFEALVGVLEEAISSAGSVPGASLGDLVALSFRHKWYRTLMGARVLYGSFGQQGRQKQRYYSQKFGGFTRCEVDDRISAVQQILNKRVRYRYFSDSLFLVEGID